MQSCNSEVDGFYKISHVEDTDVLPLIKPYRLWSPISGYNDWHLDFMREVNGRYGNISQTNVCKINVSNHIIYGQADYGPNFCFVIIPSEKIEKGFNNKEDWLSFLRAHGVNGNDLYDVLDVYNIFKRDYKKLPWIEQVKNM